MDLCLSSMDSSYHSVDIGHRKSIGYTLVSHAAWITAPAVFYLVTLFYGAKPLNITFLLWGKW